MSERTPDAGEHRLAVMLDMAGRRCLVVGGGAVALRRTTSLLAGGAVVTAVSPQFDAGFMDTHATRICRHYVAKDCEGAFLVVAATGDADVNRAAHRDAALAGALTNRADAGAAGDLTFMAARRDGPLTVAVDSGGTSAAAAKSLVQTASDAIGPDWPVLLEEARRRRAALRGRPEALRRLTDPTALDILKRCGRAALAVHLDAVVAGPEPPQAG